MNPNERERVIVRTSIVGIVANVLLVAFKAAVGLAANSIAIVLDAVNNLTDALYCAIAEEAKALYPDYDFTITLDRDLSD